MGALGAGGDEQRVADLVAGGNGGYLGVGVLGVAVDEHVDAGDLGENVNGAVARGLVADAEVAEADDVIAAVGHESVNLVLGVAVELVPGHEADADYLGRMGLGGGLGGLKAEEAYLGAADLDGPAGVEHGLAVAGDVGDDGELGVLGDVREVLPAVVKLVVAQRGHIVAGEVHELDGGGALGLTHIDAALDEVAVVDQQHRGALGLVLGLEGRDLGVVLDGAVDVVGVDDDDLAGGLGGGLLGRGLFLGGRFFLSLFAFGRSLCRVAGLFGGGTGVSVVGGSARRIGRAAQGEDHSEHEQQAQQLLACLHVYPPS